MSDQPGEQQAQTKADRTRRLKVHYSSEQSRVDLTTIPSQDEGSSVSSEEFNVSQPGSTTGPSQPLNVKFEGSLSSEGKPTSQGEVGLAPPGSVQVETAPRSSSLAAEHSPGVGSPEAEPPPSAPVSPNNSFESDSVSQRLFASTTSDQPLSESSDSRNWNVLHSGVASPLPPTVVPITTTTTPGVGRPPISMSGSPPGLAPTTPTVQPPPTVPPQPTSTPTPQPTATWNQFQEMEIAELKNQLRQLAETNVKLLKRFTEDTNGLKDQLEDMQSQVNDLESERESQLERTNDALRQVVDLQEKRAEDKKQYVDQLDHLQGKVQTLETDKVD